MISVAVMAHRSREHLVLDLVQSIDADVMVAWDERNNEWDTGRRAIGLYDPTARWHVVLQDDALLCRDLVAGLSAALATRLDRPPPNAMVGLYVGAVNPYAGRVARMVARADAEGCGWLRLLQLHWGVGVVLPVPMIPDILSLGDRTHVLEYDRRLSTVARKLRMPIWYTWPSLVDHRAEPSLLRHDRAVPRHAHRFEGTGWSALDHRWWEGQVLVMESAHSGLQSPRRVTRTMTP